MSSEEVKAEVRINGSFSMSVVLQSREWPRSFLLARWVISAHVRTHTLVCTCKNYLRAFHMHCYSPHPSRDRNSITEVREADWLQSIIFPVIVSVGHFLVLLCRGQLLWLLQAPQRERQREGRLWMNRHSTFSRDYIILVISIQIIQFTPNLNICFVIDSYFIPSDTCLHIKWAPLPHD